MKIQSIANPNLCNNRKVNKSSKTQNCQYNSNLAFKGDYAKMFKLGLDTQIRVFGDSCRILKNLCEALKNENVIKNSTYFYFMNYTVGELISKAAKTPDMIIAEPSKDYMYPFIEIEDGVLICHDSKSSSTMSFYYNKDKNRFSFQRTIVDYSDTVKKEFYKFWPNGKIREKTVGAIWDGGSSSNSEYFDKEGNRSNYWNDLFS